MRIQAVFLVLLCTASGAMAGEDSPVAGRQECFDFSRPTIKSAKMPPPLKAPAGPGVSVRSGQLGGGPVWAAVRGQVQRPLEELVKLLSEHEATKSKRISDMEVKRLSQPGYLIRQKVHYTVKPFLFVKVEWTEDWAFKVTRGTQAKPEEVAVLYEKTDGTSHIRHLCGTIVLQKRAPDLTDVSMYEEVEATGRSREDTAKGLVSSVKTLRSKTTG